MKSKSYKFSVLLIVIFLFTGVNGQNTEGINNSTRVQDVSYFSAEINFINDAIFMGRKDSISAPYLYPSITYHNKSGFYATGSLSYLTRSEESRND